MNPTEVRRRVAKIQFRHRDELPEGLRWQAKRLKRLQEAKARLEEKAARAERSGDGSLGWRI